MATQISRVFNDISLSFSRNPLTNDLIILQNENAIKKSVINLISTQIGERFFRSLIGTSLSSSIFELNSYEVSETVSEEIKNLLENFEPRIKVQDVQVIPEEDSYELNIEITYNIIGLPIPPQTIDFILQPSRL
jgi:phage baseplate assembly protein W